MAYLGELRSECLVREEVEDGEAEESAVLLLWVPRPGIIFVFDEPSHPPSNS